MKFRLLFASALALGLCAGNALAHDTSGTEGCTPGYWRQEQHFGSWTVPYTPDTPLRSVFVTVPPELIPDDTLLEALNYGGGPGVEGATQILLRAAVAALLNAAAPDLDFSVSVGHVISTTTDRIEQQHRGTILIRAEYFDLINNMDCPLGRAE